MIFSTGPIDVVSHLYKCSNPHCRYKEEGYASEEAERLHLKNRRFSRELVIQIGYRRFWQNQTMYELYEWLTTDLALTISARQVLNLIGDFLALLKAGQPAKVRQQMQTLDRLIIGIDGMQPEKGNTCLYVVRECQLGLTLVAENLANSRNTTLSQHILEPLLTLVSENGVPWYGVVSDGQASIRLALQKSLPDVPHQLCQFHILRTAGQPTFEADRHLKKRLKAAYRDRLRRATQTMHRLPASNPYKAVLTEYADAIHSTLLMGGVAPFDLGGIRLFDALTDVAASLHRCQKKATTHSCVAY